MTVEENFHSISDLKHDPELAKELGEMLVTWAWAESSLMMTLSCVLDTDLNQIEPAYYRIPTFEARTKFIRALLLEWTTTRYDKDAIANVVGKLASLSTTRNGWVHGVWCIKGNQTVILDFRAQVGSSDRCRSVKVADVRNHINAVKQRTHTLTGLIGPWLDKCYPPPSASLP